MCVVHGHCSRRAPSLLPKPTSDYCVMIERLKSGSEVPLKDVVKICVKISVAFPDHFFCGFTCIICFISRPSKMQKKSTQIFTQMFTHISARLFKQESTHKSTQKSTQQSTQKSTQKSTQIFTHILSEMKQQIFAKSFWELGWMAIGHIRLLAGSVMLLVHLFVVVGTCSLLFVIHLAPIILISAGPLGPPCCEATFGIPGPEALQSCSFLLQVSDTFKCRPECF
jgi:hypothetical protein